MPSDDKTVFDPGATMPESGKTVLDSAATVLETGAETVPDDGTTMLEATLSDAAERAESPASNAAIQKGETILDTYRVESDAIEGGMGSVWRVHHTGWDVDLAMKRPQPQCFSTEKSKADFIRECEAWINLGLHPNIVSCYYVREISGTPSIFSEWMDGGSLESAIQKETLYEGAEAAQQERLLDLAIQFARGLHYAHEAGLIHQDVKPDNVLLTKEGEAKVADFGLARARAVLTVLESAVTMTEAADGGKTMLSPSGGYTPAYCSMEQMDGKPLTRRTDIYSWAVSVMEMYLGSRPWANGVVAGLGCRSYFEQARAPVPEALKELLTQCLDGEPENRPHDFAEIEATLHEIYKAETGGAYPRPAPKAAADTADSLNNRALSFLDLGKTAEAEACWGRALKNNPRHAASMCNLQQQLWNSGKIDDIEAVSRLKALEKDTRAEVARRLINQFYLHTNDYDSLSRQNREWSVADEMPARLSFDARNPGNTAIMSAVFTQSGDILAGGDGRLFLFHMDMNKGNLSLVSEHEFLRYMGILKLIRTDEADVFDCYYGRAHSSELFKVRLNIRTMEHTACTEVSLYGGFSRESNLTRTYYDVRQNVQHMRLAFHSVSSGRCLRTYPGFCCADISSDGRYALLIERERDGFLRVVELPKDEPLGLFTLSVIAGTRAALANEEIAQRILHDLHMAVAAKDYDAAARLLKALHGIPGFESAPGADDAETALAGACKAERIAFAIPCPHRQIVPAPIFQGETGGKELEKFEEKLKKQTIAKTYEIYDWISGSQPHKQVHIQVVKLSIKAGIAVCIAGYKKAGRYGSDYALCREMYRTDAMRLICRYVVESKEDRGYLVSPDGSVAINLFDRRGDRYYAVYADDGRCREVFSFYGEPRAMALSPDKQFWAAIIDFHDNEESAVVIINIDEPENMFRITLPNKQAGEILRFSQDGLILEGSDYCIRLGYDYDPTAIKTPQKPEHKTQNAPRRRGLFGKNK